MDTSVSIFWRKRWLGKKYFAQNIWRRLNLFEPWRKTYFCCPWVEAKMLFLGGVTTYELCFDSDESISAFRAVITCFDSKRDLQTFHWICPTVCFVECGSLKVTCLYSWWQLVLLNIKCECLSRFLSTMFILDKCWKSYHNRQQVHHESHFT